MAKLMNHGGETTSYSNEKIESQGLIRFRNGKTGSVP